MMLTRGPESVLSVEVGSISPSGRVELIGQVDVFPSKGEVPGRADAFPEQVRISTLLPGGSRGSTEPRRPSDLGSVLSALRGPNGLSSDCVCATRAKRSQLRQDGARGQIDTMPCLVTHPGIHNGDRGKPRDLAVSNLEGSEQVCVARTLQVSSLRAGRRAPSAAP